MKLNFCYQPTVRYNDSIDNCLENCLEHVFCLHYLHHNGVSDRFTHRKNAECCNLKIFSFNWRKMYVGSWNLLEFTLALLDNFLTEHVFPK